ncbi:MAG: 5'-nucleotidase C-terminal domain-containing protein [Bacteroidetes bacterium]|nr:5'-nucleotidase C-terminal domain-containing protein [Bacteroidota bacterium]
MRRIVFSLLLWLFAASLTLAQEHKVRFEFAMTRMDTLYDAAPPLRVSRIMHHYRPELEKEMMQVVGFAPAEMRAFRPQSPLSNFAADALWRVAAQYSREPVDFSLTNFGGLRASFPQGVVRIYDVYAVFPFENSLVLLELEGKDVQELFQTFAGANRMEAVGNVEVEIVGRKITKLLIGGQPFDPEKRYTVATIDFLLGGGDSVTALKRAVTVVDTGVMIRDVVLQYMSILKSEGKEVEAAIDNRIKIRNNE